MSINKTDELNENIDTEMGLTLLAQAGMRLHYWWDAFSAAVHLINRLPTPTLQNLSPLEALFKQKPDYQMPKTFACACYPHLIRPYNQHKLQFRSSNCVYLGFSSNHKGYKCLSSTGRIYISRNVIFDEDDFPFQSGFTV